MSGRFANREVCDLIISDYATQEPLLYCDYANTNSTELTSESVHAFGGWGHPKRIGFNGEKGGSLTVETQIQSFQLWKMLTGGAALKTTNQIDVNQIVQDSGSDVISFTALPEQRGFHLETLVSGSGNAVLKTSFHGIKDTKYAFKMHVVKPQLLTMTIRAKQGGSTLTTYSLGGNTGIDRNCEFVFTSPINGDVQIEFTIQAGSISTAGLAIDVVNICCNETILIVERERVQSPDGSRIYLSHGTADNNSIYVYNEADDCGRAVSFSKASAPADAPLEGVFIPGRWYIVYYIAYSAAGSQSLNIKSTTFPKAVSISAYTYNKSENDEILPYQIRVYKAQPQASLTLQNSNTGDPVTLTMTFDLLADKANNMLDMILLPPMPADIAYVSAVAGSGKITVTWPESEYAASYRLARQAGAGTWELLNAAFTGTTYEDTNVVAGTPYKYAVRPENATGQAGVKSSDPVTVYTSRSGTFSPTSFSVSSNSDTTSTITLTYPGGGEPSFSAVINGLPQGSHTNLSILDKSVTESGGVTTVTFKIKLTESGAIVADSYTARVTATVPESGAYDSFSKTLNGTVTITN